MANNGPSLHVSPRELIPGNGPLSQVYLKPVGSTAGAALMKDDTDGYTIVAQVPFGSTLTAGLTFNLYVTDDGKTADDLGKGVVVGVTPKKLASNTDTLAIGTGAAAEATGTATLNASSGIVQVVSIAILNAALDGLAAGDFMLLRIRRIGSNAADTALGTAVLLGVDIHAH